MTEVKTPRQRMERIQERLRTTAAVPRDGETDDGKATRTRDDRPQGAGAFCQWGQWEQFRQIQ